MSLILPQRGILGPSRNLLAYPAGVAPGIDLAHPASGNLIFSSVASGANHVSLTQGTPGTGGSTNLVKISGTAGPGMRGLTHRDVNVGTTFTGIHPAQVGGSFLSNCTLAAIVEVVNNDLDYNTILLADNLNVVGPGIALSVTTTSFAFASSGIGYPDTAPFVYQRPYFIAYGASLSGTVDWVCRDLTTGVVTTGTIAHPGQGGGTSGTGCTVGNAATGAIYNLCGTTYATMISSQRMSMAGLLEWSEDPWSFWYPQYLPRGALLSAAAGGGGSSVKFRKTLSLIGSRIGGRASQGS